MTSIVSNSGFSDESSLKALLGELSTDLPDNLKRLLQDPLLNDKVLQFLDQVCSIESEDYLSAAPPNPLNDFEGKDEPRTLIQDIAELEAQQRLIDTNLKNLIVQSQSSILDNKRSLNVLNEAFHNEFIPTFKTLWKVVYANESEDSNAKNTNDDQPASKNEIHELESDLDAELAETKLNDGFHSKINKLKEFNYGEDKSKNLNAILGNMDQILDISDLPTLVRSCIKAGYYSEASEISAYTRRLAIRFSDNDFVKVIEEGVQKEIAQMLTGLIRLLRTNMKQSSVIKTMSYLRRIPPFNNMQNADSQLKRILLHARYEFIKLELNSLGPLRDTGQYEIYLKRSIEIIRENCFGSIMSYKNVFPDVADDELGNVDIQLEPNHGTETLSEKGESNSTSTSTPEISRRDDNTDNVVAHIVSKELDERTEKDTNDGQEIKYRSPNELENTGTSNVIHSDTNVGIELTDNRNPVHLLIFDFVNHVLLELEEVIKSSWLNIKEPTVKDGLSLQLIYCAQSLGRIDVSFSELMTTVILNSKITGTKDYLVDRHLWTRALEKQKQLSKSLLK
ncbi:hypothetical protein WICMUC_004480 [Wickerhamomyces mucosus]|uniref:Conserved oligomeric Golgi complex subunit 8 n=1 Tax=Wickerhamomyces mucosus TaxID=1378264 RepID=A0A9P8TA43_9ASCO|nr:hypothetical protein WICMUC_004480 [Wickerhamomyces mucosus]